MSVDAKDAVDDSMHSDALTGGDDDAATRDVSGMEEPGEDPSRSQQADDADESLSSVDDDDDDEDLDEDDRMVVEMPKEERDRIKDVVWAKSGKWVHYPALIYHPA